MKGRERNGIKGYRGAGRQPRKVKEFTEGVLQHCPGELLRDTGRGRGLKSKG